MKSSEQKKGVDLLIVKKSRTNQSNIEFKVKRKMSRGIYGSSDYKNVINIKDPKKLAMVLDDLKIMFDAPIEKAYEELRKKKSPFW